MKKFSIDIILNVVLIILEVIGLIVAYNSLGSVDLTYYTIDSNIFALIAAVLYLITRKNIPKMVHFFKYSSTISVLITFLVVIFILLPMYNFNFEFLLLYGPNLYLHVLCPIIAVISFIFFEKNDVENSLKNNLRAIYFTIIYAVILICLNILGYVSGPYPFLKVTEQPIFMSVFWIVLILGFSFILSRFIMTINDLYNILN